MNRNVRNNEKAVKKSGKKDICELEIVDVENIEDDFDDTVMKELSKDGIDFGMEDNSFETSVYNREKKYFGHYD